MKQIGLALTAFFLVSGCNRPPAGQKVTGDSQSRIETRDNQSQPSPGNANFSSTASVAAGNPQLIDAEHDSEYWKNPLFYQRLRTCAGDDFNKENSDYRAFSESLHRCYAEVTGDTAYNYYVQSFIETCYRRQYQAECKTR